MRTRSLISKAKYHKERNIYSLMLQEKIILNQRLHCIKIMFKTLGTLLMTSLENLKDCLHL